MVKDKNIIISIDSQQQPLVGMQIQHVIFYSLNPYSVYCTLCNGGMPEYEFPFYK